MSDQITKPVLRYLGNIFGLARSGPRMIELDLPVITSLDVARAAELDSGIGRALGWCGIDLTNIHVGAGTMTNVGDMTAALAVLGPLYDPSQHLAWLFDTTVLTGTTGIFTSAHERITIQTQGPPSANTNVITLWRKWLGVTVDSGVDLGTPVYESRNPIPMIGALVDVVGTSTVTAAGTIIFRHLLWIGSKGARPPFVA